MSSGFGDDAWGASPSSARSRHAADDQADEYSLCGAQIRNLASRVNKVKMSAPQIGRGSDSANFREKLTKELQSLSQKASRIEEMLQSLRRDPQVTAAQLERLRRTAADASTQLREVSSTVRDLIARKPLPSGSLRGIDGEESSRSSRRAQQQQQQGLEAGQVNVQLREFNDVHLTILQERAEEAQMLARDAADLKGQFQTVAAEVNAQSEQISHIDVKLEEAHASTTAGVKDLGKAVESQRAYRKKMCCLLFIVIAILVAVCIPVILTLK